MTADTVQPTPPQARAPAQGPVPAQVPAQTQSARDELIAYSQARKAGDPKRATAHLAQAIVIAARTGEKLPSQAHFDLGCLLYEDRRPVDAEQVLRRGLAQYPGDFAMLNCLGVVLKAQGRYDEALQQLDAASRVAPDRPSPWINRGSVFLELGRPQDALPAFEQALRLSPEDPQVERLVGVAHRGCGDMTKASQHIGGALERDPNDIRNWLDLAWLQEELGALDRSWTLVEQAIARFGHKPDLIVQRTIFLRRRGKHKEAIDWLRGLAQALPDEPVVHHQLALTLGPYDRLTANQSFHRAMTLDPKRGQVIVDFADSLLRTRQRDEAKHIQAAYDLARHRMSLGGTLPMRETKPVRDIFQRCADYDAMAAVGSFDALGRYFADTGLLAGLHPMLGQVRTPEDRRKLVDWHRRAGDRQQSQAFKTPLPARAPRARRAKIRVGFMSSDLRDHPVSYFVGPMLEQYDRTRFEFHCYSWSSRAADEQQKRFAGLVDRFHHVPSIGNRDAAALIAADEVDVLFELGGSTDMNKLEAMSWRPAPRQASWLGYPHSAGYTTIDRLLVDPYIEPQDPALLLEQPFRMPATWVAFDTLGFGPPPEIDPRTPQERHGHVTFGTMNNPMKYNAEVFASWAEVLSKVPGSRFLFVRPEGAVPAFRDNIGKLFARHGVDPQRIDYVPVRGAHLPHYNRIDVALDAFPQTGGTTTCETLWMGVPVVARVGEAFFERLSYSNLSNAGLPELVAPTREQYVATAVDLAARTEWRTEFRRSARERLRAHPLGDTCRFIRDFEQAVIRWMDEGAAND